MFAPAPGKCVGKCESLIELAALRRIRESRKRCKADSRQPPIERIGGDAADACVPCDVQNVGVQVCRGHMIVVVIHAEHVRCPATTVRPTGAGIQPLQTVAASQ